ncbi:Arylacetamide deacetylase [Podospora aff. communis PSN243]|uniref:Arylacetamide deacetylase n=1 Tax=Podospora aff. communis PSN243 TaxID=3040156 RepID=A0AAV9GJH8_9PEZI|nr:Arylacetamide deacetylase [Podospora aff. communis PSN243]
MPSYEPQPRRFSIITVSRSASRRNSIDEPFNPALATGPPPTPSYSSAVDLSEALKNLQHANDGNERGRSREVAGERAIRTTWGHDEPIKIPSARRDSSASTRDRIAMWEQRSRSQSKGRSKSRGRGLEAGSRISVVPEVPELLAALAQLEGKQQTKETSPLSKHDSDDPPSQNTDDGTAELKKPEDSRDESASDASRAAPSLDPTSTEGSELISDPWKSEEFKPIETPLESTEEEVRPVTDEAESDVGNEAMGTGDQETKDSRTPDATVHGHDHNFSSALQTPTRISPNQLPTPSNTPPPTDANAEFTSEYDADAKEISAESVNDTGESPRYPKTPSTPIQAATVPQPPLTPDATPARVKRSASPVVMTFGGELDPTTSQSALPIAPASLEPESPVAEPTYRHIKSLEDRDWEDDTAGDNFHLPSGLLSESAIERPTQARVAQESEDPQVKEQSKWPSQREAPRAVQAQQDPLVDETDSRYHNVWKIQDYEPEFPLPSKPSAIDAETKRLARADFTGNPLQELPKSQLSAEAEPFKPLAKEAPNPYPYPTQGPATRGDFSVRIPPSPTTTYAPGDNHTRQPRQRSRSRQAMRDTRDRYTSRNATSKHEWDAPPVIERVIHAASVSAIQGLTMPVELYRGLRDSYYPPPGRPDIVKAYPVRRRLPVRIFFPTHHDLTSPALLPTVFTLHGGGFTVGSSADDDHWNRSFADAYTILVISLNYAKAPWAVFPAPLLDAEALYHAVLNDESLPIDRMRTAILGFDAGANLALGLSQLPSVKTGYDPTRHPHHEREYASQPYPPAHAPPRSHPPPAAVISVCGILDFTMPAAKKARTRPYKRALRGPRGWGPGLDWMAKLLPSSAWSYIPYGHDISDPYLSPAYASRADLPPHVFVIGAELDCLAHESWRTACGWAGRAVPDTDILVGRRGPSRWRGCLDDGRGENAAKFSWNEVHEKGGRGGFEGTTRWLLVPDVVHGFDSAGWRNKYLWGDEEARMDSEMKTLAYQREVAEWLWSVAWR